ncbi:MAG TPA: hypothetical protein VK601_28855 [Kofleriaceae bacterium]|nr:hypothetical protein [Kofleriaceae bacterium]
MRSLFASVLLVGCYAAVTPAGRPCPDDICPGGQVCSPATKTCEYESVPADAAQPDTAPEAQAPPRYRRRIAIYNGAATALPVGFTIRVPMPAMLAGMVQDRKVKADLSDLQVIGEGTIGERDRIADSGVGYPPAAVSFALQAPIPPGTINTDYWLHYGGASAAPALAKGTAVFPLYDDFATGISSIWQRNDGPTVVGGKLVLRAGHSDALTTTAASDGLPTVSALEIIARVADPTSGPTVQTNGESFYYWFGFQHTGDFTPTEPWALWIARNKGEIGAEQKSPVGCETPCQGPVAPQSTFAHYYVIERDPTMTRFYRDGVLAYTAAVTNQTDYAVMVRNYLATSDVEIGWNRARARVSPDPTVTLAAEEAL